MSRKKGAVGTGATAIVTLRNRTLSPVVQIFIEEARAIAESLLAGGERNR